MKKLMKSKLLALSLACITLPAFAQTTASSSICKGLFKEKIKSLEKTSSKRVKRVQALKAAALVSGGAVSGTLMILIPGGPAGFALAWGGISSVATTSSLFNWIEETDDKKLLGYQDALNLQEEMFTSYSDALEESKEVITYLLEEALEKFDNQVTHSDVVEEITKIENERRLREYEPALSESEVVALKRRELIQSYDVEPRVYNYVAQALGYLKEKKRVDEKLEYDEFREILIANQDKFCEGNEPLNLRSVLKEIFPKNP
jgi:hypothetical protein